MIKYLACFMLNQISVTWLEEKIIISIQTIQNYNLALPKGSFQKGS